MNNTKKYRTVTCNQLIKILEKETDYKFHLSYGKTTPYNGTLHCCISKNGELEVMVIEKIYRLDQLEDEEVERLIKFVKHK